MCRGGRCRGNGTMRVHATDLLLRGLEQPGLEISRRVDPAIQPSQRILATLGKHHGMLKRAHLTRAQRTDNPIIARHTGGFAWQHMPQLCGWHGGFRLDRHLYRDRVAFKGTLRGDLAVHREHRRGPYDTAIQQRDGER